MQEHSQKNDLAALAKTRNSTIFKHKNNDQV